LERDVKSSASGKNAGGERKFGGKKKKRLSATGPKKHEGTERKNGDAGLGGTQ